MTKDMRNDLEEFKDANLAALVGGAYAALTRISVEMTIANDLECFRLASEGKIQPAGGGATLPPGVVTDVVMRRLRMSFLEKTSDSAQRIEDALKNPLTKEDEEIMSSRTSSSDQS